MVRRTLIDYIQLAIEKGFIYILNEIPKNVDTPIEGWKCSQNHIRKTSYSNIKKDKKCLFCTGCNIKTLYDYKEIARLKGIFYILDYIPQGVKTPIEAWKCNLNHVWTACY